MVVRFESGWMVGDLSDSLHDRIAVPVHLFHFVVEGRVLGCDELVGNLGRGPFWENGLVLVVCGQGAGRPRTRAFVAVRHVPIPFCPLDQCRAILVLLGRRVNRGIQEGFHKMRQVPSPLPHTSTAPPSSLVTSAGGLRLDMVLQFLRALNVPPAALTELHNAVPPPVPRKTAQRQTKERKYSQLLRKQQLAKLSKRMEALSKGHNEVCEKVVAKQTRNCHAAYAPAPPPCLLVQVPVAQTCHFLFFRQKC